MPDGFHYIVTDTRRDLLLRAKDRLERVERHERWGVSAMAYADEAAELLRRAELHDLASECADEFGIDVAAVVKEIDRELIATTSA